jgi:hypothetical protein
MQEVPRPHYKEESQGQKKKGEREKTWLASVDVIAHARPGMNPVACKAAIEQAARDAGLPVPVVAAVAG